MIPNDQYTIAVTNLLVLFGLVGLVKPGWFLRVMGLPLISRRAPDSARNLRRARIWGGLCLVGALILYLLSR